jgi:hypothetical protein
MYATSWSERCCEATGREAETALRHRGAQGRGEATGREDETTGGYLVGVRLRTGN